MVHELCHYEKGKVRRRIPIVKAVASAITLVSGGSAGREGPNAQIAAGIGALIFYYMIIYAQLRRFLRS